MAWSSFAHLPNSEDVYWEILSKLSDNMTISEVDEIIALQKGKVKVQHHYRRNLAKMGFYSIQNNCISLNYDVNKLNVNKKHLKTIFQKVIKDNQASEVKEVYELIYKVMSYDLKLVVDELSIKYPHIEYNNFIRWIRPLVSIMKFAEVLSSKKRTKISSHLSYVQNLQEAYLSIAKSFSEVVALETLEAKLKLMHPALDFLTIFDYVLSDNSIKFKIELLTLPSWAANNKSFIIFKSVYTHIKVKADLTEEEIL